MLSLCLSVMSYTNIFAEGDDAALNWEFMYQGDAFHGLQGQLTDSVYYLGFLEAQIEADLEKLMQWEGMTGVVSIQGLHGRSPSVYMNTLQGLDVNESDLFTDGVYLYLYELWVQKQWQDKFAVLVGLYDLTSEFYVADSASLFVLNPFNVGSDFGQTNINGPRFHAVTNPAVRIKYTPTPQRYFQMVLMDSADSTPKAPLPGSETEEPTDAGMLGLAEMGHLFLNPSDGESAIGKLALGAWGFSKKAPTQIDEDVTAYNIGSYVMLDYPAYIAPDNPQKIAHWFMRYGVATPNVNDFSQACSAGFMFEGFVPKRPKDIISIGIAPAWVSSGERESDPTLPSMEFQSAINYAFVVNERLTVQGELQYINFQGGDKSLYPSTVNAVARFTVTIP